ncbi:MAG: hypothetical protein CL949_20445 [Erythrobacter sp.]|nr:hypothetical protein [Erythrobacter sp.]
MTNDVSTPIINTDAHVLALQVAYGISFEAADKPVATLYWALDRFYFDKAEFEDGRIQRFEATQRIARELDARNVPLRDPRAPSTYSPALLSEAA